MVNIRSANVIFTIINCRFFKQLLIGERKDSSESRRSALLIIEDIPDFMAQGFNSKWFLEKCNR